MIRRAAPALAAALVAACIFASSAHALTDTVPARSGFYGVNAQWVFDTDPSGWPAQFNSMVAAGLQVVRTDARWSVAEPGPPSGGGHTYDWSLFDTIAGTLARYGLTWMPTLGYPPPWAQEDPAANSSQDPGGLGSEMTLGHVQDFVDYASALAERYGDGGTFWNEHPSLPYKPVRQWEVWNEPNVTYYWDPQDQAPERYADLYMATRQALQRVNRHAIVLAGGLALVNPPIASDEIQFVKRMLTHRPELAQAVDVWGLHPYQQTIYWTFRRFARWRQALDLLVGHRVPIAISELGYTTKAAPSAVTDDQRGSELTTLTQELPRSGCDIYDFLPYAWESPEQNPNDPEQWFGIWNHDGTPKPSGQQFAGAVLQMRGLSSTPPPTDGLNLCDSQYPVPPDPQPPAQPQTVAPGPPTTSKPPAPPPGPPALAPPKPRGPRVQMSLRRRGRVLTVRVRCRSACRLDAYVMTRLKGHARYRTGRPLHGHNFSSRVQTLRLRLPRLSKRLVRRAELLVVAYDRSGATTRSARAVSLR
ncbi:MAG TPA: hypothetical protein VFL87_04505 [Thermoleophilaceae bacterium]|nr:hypothetical protein [Thermoleophilaceae bacterium]